VTTILVIDDSEVHRRALKEALEGPGTARVLLARDGIEGLKRLLSEPVDLVICDLEMPGLDGGKLIPMSRSAQGHEVPFVMITAVQDPHRRAWLFREGARDVVTKPFDPEELLARIQTHLERVRLQKELIEKNRLLEELSTTDALTGLSNRRYLDETLGLEFMRARRHGTPLAVVMSDVDHFKQVNDRFGHPAGDRVLRMVAQILQRRLRATDFAGRYGGEEFLIILGSSQDGASLLAERWRVEIEEAPLDVATGSPIAVTMSFGVASITEDMDDPGDLIEAADAALYGAKAAGRNQVVVAGPRGGSAKNAAATAAGSPTHSSAGRPSSHDSGSKSR
jgi:two-component system cell cycle response regulator